MCLFQRLRLRKKDNTQTKLGQLGNEVHMVHLTLMHRFPSPREKLSGFQCKIIHQMTRPLSYAQQITLVSEQKYQDGLLTENRR